MARLTRVISGGQTGADIAALRAAKAVGIATGGWAPRGWLTEAGPAPWLADYGLKEHARASYPPRTRQNIIDSDATIIFAADPESPGTKLACTEAYQLERPSLVCVVNLEGPIDLGRVGAYPGWLARREVKVLNIGGNRESKAPGIGAWVEAFLTAMFHAMEEE